MVILGLTGSIGMGKTVAAGMLQRLGAVVHDADRSVHALLAKGGAAVGAVGAAFPGTVHDGAVVRTVLSGQVFGKPEALARLEAILHPLVRADERRTLAVAARQRRRVVVLDIPLLYETAGEKRVDEVVVVSAPSFLQRLRVLARSGMTDERLARVLSRQMPDAEKRRRADYVVATGLGRAFSFRVLSAILKRARRRGGRRWRQVRPRPRG